MFENFGGAEMLLIFLVVLLFFGPKKIPELASSMGKGLRKFREAKDGLEGQIKTAIKEPMEALEAAKTNFQNQVNAAAEPFKEAAKSIDSPASKPTTPNESTEVLSDVAKPDAPVRDALKEIESPPMIPTSIDDGIAPPATLMPPPLL